MQTIPNAIILGAGLADKLGVQVDDNLAIISSKGVVLDMKIVARTGIDAGAGKTMEEFRGKGT
jgi:ABC-type lipoprotein release transport system permease subunit